MGGTGPAALLPKWFPYGKYYIQTHFLQLQINVATANVKCGMDTPKIKFS